MEMRNIKKNITAIRDTTLRILIHCNKICKIVISDKVSEHIFYSSQEKVSRYIKYLLSNFVHTQLLATTLAN